MHDMQGLSRLGLPLHNLAPATPAAGITSDGRQDLYSLGSDLTPRTEA